MKLKFFATYRPITHCKELDIPVQKNVLALLQMLVARYPDFADKLLDPSGTELGPEAIVFVNGRHIQHLDGVDTKLVDEDVVSLFPLVAGG